LPATFIFWLKNPAGINDDFWSLFLTIWIAGFTYIFFFVKFFLPGRKPLPFYICGNIDPKYDWTLPVLTSGHFEVFSLIFCIIVKLKVHFFKEKFSNQDNLNVYRKKFAINDFQKTSLTSYVTNLGMLSVYFTFVFIAFKLSEIYPTNVNQFPYDIYLYFLQLIFPNLIGFAILGLLYGKNSLLRENILTELKNAFAWNP